MDKIKKVICALLCLLLLPGLFSCTKKKAAMTFEGASLSGEAYGYYIACYKQYWLTYFGQTDSPSFWGAEADGITNAERLTGISREAIKKRLVCSYLFDASSLKLTDGEKSSIERMIAAMKDTSSGGKGIENDEVFKALGIKEDDLRDILMLDSKTAAFQDHLYGDDGVKKITDEERERYYNENYYKFRLLFLMNSDFVRDENGNIVYGEGGAAKITEITDDRYEEKLALAKDILEKVRAGESLQTYIDEYSEELERDDYKNGRYLSAVSEYGSLISAAVMKLSVGEAGLLQAPTGIYVLQREETDPYAWKNEENEAGGDFYNFELLVTEHAFDEYLGPYLKKVTENEDVTGKYKMEELPYTFSWQYLF